MSRQERAEQTREELLRAATRVFADRGYTRATYREIAEAAGYSRGLVHFHFQSKSLLGVEVTRRAFVRWAELVARGLAEGPGNGQLERLLDVHEALVLDDRPLVRLALQLMFDTSDEAREIRAILRQLDLGTSGARIATEFFGTVDDSVPETLSERGWWLLAALRGLELRAALGAPDDQLRGAYSGLRRDLATLLAHDGLHPPGAI